MPDSEIQPIPLPVPKEIIEAVNNGRLAIFIGAGVSRLIGCKGWDELGRRLLERCFTTKKSNGSTLISYKVKEKLVTIPDNKKLITICHYILKNAHLEDVFFDEMRQVLKPQEDLLKTGNIYDELIGLPALYVTTNADTIFDSKFNEENIKFRITDCDASTAKPPKLYHIHGSINDPETMVFTVDKYIQQYRDQNFSIFLKTIFAEYRVLFVGYGLAEFELLDFIIPRMDPSQSKEARHFMLLGLYSGEDAILEYERYYYNQMGISVQAYQMDEKGYFQLYEVVKRWNQEINRISTYLYDTFKMLEEAANNFDSTQVDMVLQTIRNDAPQREHFFKALASTSEPGSWLSPLVKQGYFDPGNNPQPESQLGQENLFRIPQWDVLGFLENASARNREKPNGETTKLILEIIKPLIAPGSDAKPRVDNYRTDWFLVKVISNLLPGQITAEHIGFITLALQTKWGPVLVLGEVSRTLLPRLIQEGEVALVLFVIKELFQWRTGLEDPSSQGSTLNDYWLNEILQTNKAGIIRLCSVEAAKLALEEIKKITQKDSHKFGEFEIPSLTDGDDGSHGRRGQDSYPSQLVLFTRDLLDGSSPDLIRDLVQELLSRDHPIFRRIALYTISHHYAKLSDLFWHWKENPLEDDFVRYELYSLLSANASSLSKDEIGQVLEWLEEKSYFIPDHLKGDTSEIQQLIAYWKKYWASTLLKTDDPRVVSAFEQYNKIKTEEKQLTTRSCSLINTYTRPRDPTK